MHEEEDGFPAKRMACPKCGSTDVRRSKVEGLWGSLACMFGRWPFRCRSCRVRFYRATEPPHHLD